MRSAALAYILVCGLYPWPAMATDGGPTFAAGSHGACAAVAAVGAAAQRKLLEAGFFTERDLERRFGYVLYDRKTDRILDGRNLDRRFWMLSLAKLATASAVSRNMPQLTEDELFDVVDMLRRSDNIKALAWLRTALETRRSGRKQDYREVGMGLRPCYVPAPQRSQAQADRDFVYGRRFLKGLQARYPQLDWKEPRASLATGAGCSRSRVMMDAASPRQFLAILDDLRGKMIGPWTVAEVLNNYDGQGRRMNARDECRSKRSETCKPLGTGVAFAKTGSDGDAQNLAGYIRGPNDLYRYSFAIFTQETKQQKKRPCAPGIRNGLGICGGDEYIAALVRGWVAAAPRCDRPNRDDR